MEGHAEHRARGGDGLAAVRRTPAEWFPLHAAVADRTDRPHNFATRLGESGATTGPGQYWVDIVTTGPEPPSPGACALQVAVVGDGDIAEQPSLEEARAFHARRRAAIGLEPLLLERRLGVSQS